MFFQDDPNALLMCDRDNIVAYKQKNKLSNLISSSTKTGMVSWNVLVSEMKSISDNRRDN